MDNPKKMDVVDWEDPPAPIAPKTRPHRQFLPPTLIGILGTALLHAAFIQSVSFGSRISKPKAPESQESALSKSTTGEESLVLISLPTIANTGSAVNTISSFLNLSKMKIQPHISADPPEWLNLETLALSEDATYNPTAGGSEGAEQARLFGIYTGQIQARIDRVWRRPRTPVTENVTVKNPADADESFQCEAQIIQDIRGNVQEIMLPRCNGSAAWQRSLISAIQHASPLPAPPSDKVFSRSITLSFVGLSYVPRSSDDGYEIEARTLARE